jgi:DNA repair protein RecN (Recombination protein N)
MLLDLDLKDFVLVDHTHLSLKAGFTTLTGETGAGKSILLDALGFLLGGKADASWVRHGRDKAEVAASFEIGEPARQWLSANDFSLETELQLRRTLDATGRNRCTINGSSATATQLRELGELLIDIHGQGDHQLLLKPSSQRSLIDGYARHDDLISAVKQAWEQLSAVQKTLQAAQAQQATLNTQREQLTWVYEELNMVKPLADEWESLEAEHKRLSHSATLLSTLQSAAMALDEAEDALSDRARELHHMVASLVKLDPATAQLAEPIETAYIHLQEAARSIGAYLKTADLDPERLATVEGRIALLHSTARKLRLNPAELPQRFDSVQYELAQLNAAQDIASLEAQRAQAQAQYDSHAAALSASRSASAQLLSSTVTQTMQALALNGGQFAVQLNAAPASASGVDAVEFLVTANIGQPLRTLAKVASGGELARMSLALCVVTSSQSAVPTLIFDEVDSGIGGATADIVGQHLRQLGIDVQVLAVTHLPQVAANAHQQLKVSKQLENGQTVSHVAALSEEQRVDEIARMLGGENVTVTTRYHAQELLSAAFHRANQTALA